MLKLDCGAEDLDFEDLDFEYLISKTSKWKMEDFLSSKEFVRFEYFDFDFDFDFDFEMRLPCSKCDSALTLILHLDWRRFRFGTHRYPRHLSALYRVRFRPRF